MRRTHRIIFFFIALLAMGTFVFAILELIGSLQGNRHSVPPR
jgi:hypothetical protein